MFLKVFLQYLKAFCKNKKTLKLSKLLIPPLTSFINTPTNDKNFHLISLTFHLFLNFRTQFATISPSTFSSRKLPAIKTRRGKEGTGSWRWTAVKPPESESVSAERKMASLPIDWASIGVWSQGEVKNKRICAVTRPQFPPAAAQLDPMLS